MKDQIKVRPKTCRKKKIQVSMSDIVVHNGKIWTPKGLGSHVASVLTVAAHKAASSDKLCPSCAASFSRHPIFLATLTSWDLYYILSFTLGALSGNASGDSNSSIQ